MNVYDGMHWNIYEILPYQRNFNLINSERSIGKTYTTEFYVVAKCIEKAFEFVYIVRTKKIKEKGAFEKGMAKVIKEKFPDCHFEFTVENMFLVEEDIETGKNNKTLIGHCIALSEENETKNMSYPNVKYLIFDEYVIEEKSHTRYYNGWDEPTALLKIYHTIDREEDRVICFLLGNNIRFHNPYHMHKAFRIPFTEKGKIWTSENVLFQNAVSSAELKEKKSKSKFVRMITDTDYGKYANDGEYMGDNYSFVEKMHVSASYSFTLEYEGEKFGIYSSYKTGIIYVTDKIDPSCLLSYALTVDDHKENTMLTRNRSVTHLKWLADNFKIGNVRFENMEVKTKCERGIALLL